MITSRIGIDGFRVDTAKHTEVTVWQEFRVICDAAFALSGKASIEAVLDQSPFYLVGRYILMTYTI